MPPKPSSARPSSAPLPVPDTARTADVRSDAMRIGVAFARVLRGAGVVVPIGCVLSFAEGIEVVGLEDRDNVYWTGRSTLLHRPEDIETYDRAFKVFWEHRGTSMDFIVELPSIDIQLAVDSDEEEGDDDGRSFRRGYNLSFRGELAPSETLVKGRPFSGAFNPAKDAPAPIVNVSFPIPVVEPPMVKVSLPSPDENEVF